MVESHFLLRLFPTLCDQKVQLLVPRGFFGCFVRAKSTEIAANIDYFSSLGGWVPHPQWFGCYTRPDPP